MIEVNNQFSFIHAPGEILTKLLLAFQIEDPKKGFNPAYPHYWDGYVKLITPTGRFKTGLLPIVVRYLRKKKVPIIFTDNRDLAEFTYKPDYLLKFKNEDGALYEHQSKILVKACNRHFQNLVWNRGIIDAATNAGKTEIACAMYNSYNSDNNITMIFIVHRKHIFDQTVKRLTERLQKKIGMIQGKNNNIEQVTVATIQSLNSKMKTNKNFIKADMLFFDECHIAASPSAEKAIKNISATIIYGLSGTPFTDIVHKYKLMGNIGPVISRVSNKYLMDKGISADTIVKFIEYEERTDFVDYKHDYREFHIHNNNNRNDALIDRLLEEKWQNKQCIFVVDRIDHGKALQQRFLKRGIKVPFVHGSSSDRFRELLLKKLTDNTQKWVICSTIWKEGLDTPNISLVAMMLGGSSIVTIKQFIGRGIRRKTDGIENVLEVWDFIDLCHKKLKEHTINRIVLFIKEQFKFGKIPECLKNLSKRIEW